MIRQSLSMLHYLRFTNYVVFAQDRVRDTAPAARIRSPSWSPAGKAYFAAVMRWPQPWSYK